MVAAFANGVTEKLLKATDSIIYMKIVIRVILLLLFFKIYIKLPFFPFMTSSLVFPNCLPFLRVSCVSPSLPLFVVS